MICILLSGGGKIIIIILFICYNNFNLSMIINDFSGEIMEKIKG